MYLASLISTLFEPMIVLYVLALVGGKHANLPANMWPVYAATLTIFCLLVFAIRLFFKKKDHTNWDISDRKKRFVPLSILTVFIGVLCMFVRIFGNPELTSLFVSMLFWATGFLLITLKIKLSGHVGILTFALCQFIVWYGMMMVPFVLLIPLLAWSRLSLKRHTLTEIFIGITYSGMLFLLSASIIGR